MTITRRQLLQATATAVGGATALSLLNCGPGDACGAVIQLNHGHQLVVTHAQTDAGVDMTYNIQHLATHNHEVTLTTADFASLAAGNTVTVISGVDDAGATHQHTITINCA